MSDSISTRPELLSATDVVQVAGCTYRQIDYWCRIGTMTPHTPARGCGTSRRFTLAEAAICRAFTLLSSIGMRNQKEFVRLVTAVAADNSLLGGAVAISVDGSVAVLDCDNPPVAGYVIDLSACRAHVLAETRILVEQRAVTVLREAQDDRRTTR